MKKLLFALMFCGLGHSLFAQSQETVPGDSVPWEIRKQSFIYNSATLYNDPLVARMALYNLLAENPRNVPLYDSLALSYLRFNQYASAALVSQQALQIDPENMFALEIAATSFENIGAKDRALDQYEKLHLANGDINILYKISFLQMELERYAESNTSLDIIINDPQSEEMIITFPKVDGSGQEVTLKVAAHRVKAMIEESKGNIEAAKIKYLEVLEMLPGFEVVQQQLRELTKSKQEGE